MSEADRAALLARFLEIRRGIFREAAEERIRAEEARANGTLLAQSREKETPSVPMFRGRRLDPRG